MKKGITLIELIVAFLVIAIIGIRVAPRVINLGEIRLHMAMTKVAQDMRYVHEYAVNNNCRTRIVYSGGTDTYTVYENSSGSWQIMKDPTTKENFTVRLNTGNYTGVRFGTIDLGRTNELIFDSIGRPYNEREVLLSSNGTVQLKVSTPAGGEKKSNINVAPVTGSILLGA